MCVVGQGVEFFAEQFAADGEAQFGIAEGAKRGAVETEFAGGLSHDLHESPGKAAGVSFGGGDFVVGVERGDVLGEEKGFVAHGPRIPGGFLFDDGADERGIEIVGSGGFASESDELGWGGHEWGLLASAMREEVRDPCSVNPDVCCSRSLQTAGCFG